MVGPVDELLEGVRAALHSRQAAGEQRISGLSAALRAYATAKELELAACFAREHQLRAPKQNSITAEKCARRLLSLVEQLPELQAVAVVPPDKQTKPPPVTHSANPAARVSASAPVLSQSLLDAMKESPLVVVGGKPHPGRIQGPGGALGQRLEWVDTQSNGNSAIGNLAQRIRHGRVGALIVLEGLISHKHSDPLVQAARVSGTPHAYGGKGGQASVSRAFQQLEKMFVQRS